MLHQSPLSGNYLSIKREVTTYMSPSKYKTTIRAIDLVTFLKQYILLTKRK